MEAIVGLFSTDYGLMSLAVLAVILGMMAWFIWFFVSKMNEPEDK